MEMAILHTKAVFNLTNLNPDSDSDFSDSVNPSIQCANPNPDSLCIWIQIRQIEYGLN